MKRKFKRISNSFMCFALSCLMLFSTLSDSFAAGSERPSFSAGNSASSLVWKPSPYNPRPKLNTGLNPNVSGYFMGREYAGSGWVFGIAPYNLDTINGKAALSPQDLVKAYNEGVLIADFNPDGYYLNPNAPVITNATIQANAWLSESQFKAKPATLLAASEQYFGGYAPADSLDGSAKFIKFNEFGIYKGAEGDARVLSSPTNTKIQIMSGDDVYDGKTPISAIYEWSVDTDTYCVYRNKAEVSAPASSVSFGCNKTNGGHCHEWTPAHAESKSSYTTKTVYKSSSGKCPCVEARDTRAQCANCQRGSSGNHNSAGVCNNGCLRKGNCVTVCNSATWQNGSWKCNKDTHSSYTSTTICTNCQNWVSFSACNCSRYGTHCQDCYFSATATAKVDYTKETDLNNAYVKYWSSRGGTTLTPTSNTEYGTIVAIENAIRTSNGKFYVTSSQMSVDGKIIGFGGFAEGESKYPYWGKYVSKLLPSAEDTGHFYSRGQFVSQDDFASAELNKSCKEEIFKLGATNAGTYGEVRDFSSNLQNISKLSGVKYSYGSGCSADEAQRLAKDDAKSQLKTAVESDPWGDANLFNADTKVIFAYSYQFTNKSAKPVGFTVTMNAKDNNKYYLRLLNYGNGGTVTVYDNDDYTSGGTIHKVPFNAGLFYEGYKMPKLNSDGSITMEDVVPNAGNSKPNEEGHYLSGDLRKSLTSGLANWYMTKTGMIRPNDIYIASDWIDNRLLRYTKQSDKGTQLLSNISFLSNEYSAVPASVGYTIKFKLNRSNSDAAGNGITSDLNQFNSLWAVSQGEPINKASDLNRESYREELYDKLLSYSSFNGETTICGIPKDDFVRNTVFELDANGNKVYRDENWIYVIVAIPVFMTCNYINAIGVSGVADKGQAELEAALGTDWTQRGNTIINVYPAEEFLKYGDSTRGYVGEILLGPSYNPEGKAYVYSRQNGGAYKNLFKATDGVYGIGHNQYLPGIPDSDENPSCRYKTNSWSDAYDLIRHPEHIYNVNPDTRAIVEVPVEPDFKGFAVYGNILDLNSRFSSSIVAYLDSTSFDASAEKSYTDVKFSNVGVRDMIVDRDFNYRTTGSAHPLDYNLFPWLQNASDYTTEGLSFKYTSVYARDTLNGNLFRPAVTQDFADKEVTGVVDGEYADYDVQNEAGQFYLDYHTDGNWVTIMGGVGNYSNPNAYFDYLSSVKDHARVTYEVEAPVSGKIAFGDIYTTRVTFDADPATKQHLLTTSLRHRLHDMPNISYRPLEPNWSAGGWDAAYYPDSSGTEGRLIGRFLDRARNGYSNMQQRARFISARLMENTLINSAPFQVMGSAQTGYQVKGSGKVGVSVQVYEKRKTNQSYAVIYDVAVDDNGNYLGSSYVGEVASNPYYYDEVGSCDWTNSGTIPLIVDSPDKEVANIHNNADASNFFYIAVPNDDVNYGRLNGNENYKNLINSSNYKKSQVTNKLGTVGMTNVGEVGATVGTTPTNNGYTVYVLRYYIPTKDGTVGDNYQTVVSDSALYLEDYELSHVYHNYYNRKGTNASTIRDYYLRTSKDYQITPTGGSVSSGYIRSYTTWGLPQMGVISYYGTRTVENKYLANLMFNEADSTHASQVSAIGSGFKKHSSDPYYWIQSDNKYSTVFASNLINSSGSPVSSDFWLMPEFNKFTTELDITAALSKGFNPFSTNIDYPIGFGVMLTRDMSYDKVTLSGMTKNVVPNNEFGYTDSIRKSFIEYLKASNVIVNGTASQNVPVNTDAVTGNKVNGTVATVATPHKVVTGESYRKGSDLKPITGTTDKVTSAAGFDSASDVAYYSALTRISTQGGWTPDSRWKLASTMSDITNIQEATRITNNLYGTVLGVGQANILKQDNLGKWSELRTIYARKDKNGDRAHGYIGSIDIYQYFYKYYTKAYEIGKNTDKRVSGALLKAQDYSAGHSNNGKLPTYSRGDGTVANGAYAQAYTKAHNITVSYYPEVLMTMQIPYIKDDKLYRIYNDTIATMGEYIRKTNLSSLYFVTVKSNVAGADSTNKLFSDNATANQNGSNSLPSLYAGADVSLVSTPEFSVVTYGYSLDLIDKNLDDGKLVTTTSNNNPYKSVIHDETYVRQAWGNPSTNDTAVAMKQDFIDFTNMVASSLDVDVTLKAVNKGSYEAGTIDASASNEDYQNFNISIGDYNVGTINDGNEDLVYSIRVAHGKLDTSYEGYVALLTQMARDYYGLPSNVAPTNAELSAMNTMFVNSGLGKSILDSIESDTDATNASRKVSNHEYLGKKNTAHGIGNSEIDGVVGEDDRWYDEVVKTFVVRRYYVSTELGVMSLDDKLDYHMGAGNTSGGNDNTQTSYNTKTFCWFLNVYMNPTQIPASNPFKDMLTGATFYNARNASNGNWYFPTNNSNDGAVDAGTVLVRNLYLKGGDFNIVSDTTSN